MFFDMPQSWDMGQILLLPLRRNVYWGFYVRKIQRLRPGLNTQTWVPEANMLTTRPPKPSWWLYIQSVCWCCRLVGPVFLVQWIGRRGSIECSPRFTQLKHVEFFFSLGSPADTCVPYRFTCHWRRKVIFVVCYYIYHTSGFSTCTTMCASLYRPVRAAGENNLNIDFSSVFPFETIHIYDYIHHI